MPNLLVSCAENYCCCRECSIGSFVICFILAPQAICKLCVSHHVIIPYRFEWIYLFYIKRFLCTVADITAMKKVWRGGCVEKLQFFGGIDRMGRCDKQYGIAFDDEWRTIDSLIDLWWFVCFFYLWENDTLIGCPVNGNFHFVCTTI